MQTAISCITNFVSLFCRGIRSSAQDTHPDRSSDLWTISRSHLTRSQWRTQATRTSPSAQQGHFRSQPCGLRIPRSLILLRRSSLSGTPTVTFSSVHIHNVVSKKRDASTDLLRRLHAHMQQHNVDFIGGDFNMSAFSAVGDVFADPESSAPGNSFLWGLGALEEANRECMVFLIIAEATIRVACGLHMAATSSTTRTLHLGPVTPPRLPSLAHHQPAWPRQHHAQ